MKTQIKFALPLLLIALGAGSAHAQLSVTGTADCPPEAFGVTGILDSAPLPVVTVKVANGATTQTGVEVDLTIPADTYFAGFLAPVPTNVRYSDGTTWSSTLPAVEPVAVRVLLGTMAGGANESFGVILRESPTAGSQTSYGVAARSIEDATGAATSRTLRLGACPALIYALNCLDGSASVCNGMYVAIEGRSFTFAGVGGTPASALTSAPTDQGGFAILPRLVDLTFLNGDVSDTSNDGYPLPGASYVISHTLPANPVAPSTGPFWSNTTAGTVAWTVGKTHQAQQVSFVDSASCVDVACQTATLQLTSDGAGVCDYEPILVGGECTVDDPCRSNFRCEGGACVGDPLVCESPPACHLDAGSCNPSMGLCVYEPIDCATQTFTFFGVIENGDGTLSSFECQINDAGGEVLCRVAGGGFAATGELLLGGPQCVVATAPNYPPYLQVSYYGAEQGLQSDLQLTGRDPENVQLQWASTNLPSGWALSTSGVVTVPASAPTGDYVIDVTLADGTNAPVPATITVQLRQPKYVFVTRMTPNPDWAHPVGFFAANFASQGGGTAMQNADAICQQQASTLGTQTIRSRTFVAWLSTSNPLVHAKDRIPDALYKLPDGTIVAQSKSDLLDGTLDLRIAVAADGSALGTTVRIWTGTTAAGESSGFDCNNWTDNTTAYQSTTGIAGNNNGVPNTASLANWTERQVTETCERVNAILYCFEL